MKKLFQYGCLALGFIFLTSTTAFSQQFGEGDAVINAGVGLGSTYSYVSGLGLPLGAGFEYGISDLDKGSIGVGGDFGIVSGSGLNITYLGAKGSYHFTELLELEEEAIDLYAGLGLYYRSFSWDADYIGISSNDMFAGFHLGGRYFFQDNLGAYAEIGNSWAWLNAGIVFSL